MNEVLNYLSKQKEFTNIVEDTREICCSNEDAFAFFVLYYFLKKTQPLIILTENLLICQNLYNRLMEMLKKDVYMYCVDEVTKFTSLATSPEMLSSRIFVLNKLQKKEPIIVVTHTMAMKRFVPNRHIFAESGFSVSLHQTLKMKEFLMKLIQIGYKNVFKVTQPFEYSTRGGVVDIFSINYEHPIRIEFFDTEVDSIRFFNADSQRTIEEVKQVEILPATEFLTNQLEEGIQRIEEFSEPQIHQSMSNLQLQSVIHDDIEHLKLLDFNENYFKYYAFFQQYTSLADYICEAPLFIFNRNKIAENERFIEEERVENVLKGYQEGMTLKDIPIYFPILEVISSCSQVRYFSDEIENKIIDLQIHKIETFDFNYELLYKQFIELLSRNYTIYIGLNNDVHYQSFLQFLTLKDLSYTLFDAKKTLKKGINLAKEDLQIGLDFEKEKLYVIGEKEIYKKRFKPIINQFSRYKNAITIASVNDLEIGDYLVHEYHGIGIYKGIETLLNQGVHKDYLHIEYKNHDVLYVPLEQFKLIRKFVSKEGVVPHINKLGSKEWDNTKKKIKERVNEIAERLVNLYSLRAEKPGFSFAKDDELQLAFENDFNYELTPDQKTVLKEIKADMEKPIIMDRLLVGDVGFGKTEIAFRAAFKAICSGKQVALLCPTTLLARQHYMTALDRFRNFGIRLKLLSRLVPEKEQNQTILQLKDGTVDFVIGTHRLLSDDVKYRDLGLLIVDEEHKFGVEHKEKIKEYKQNIDVLTLSATPIPRTLQMALTGVRGFSTINTPISNRMPVQTYVIQKDTYAIKEIIERELARNGQVYYLNNRIENLPQIARELSKTIKGAKIAIAHGKLNVDQMEDIMQQFICNEYNILLCTTIIENGIDIPNVNTIIVENADCFGLSQLYQIKGRVGRGDRLAYCYLMYNKNKDLSDVAKKRLQTIKEFTALGSGYKVAMRDLITRGAGDLLGPEQSGFIDSVGIDMYIEMLHDAIDKKRNQNQEERNQAKRNKPVTSLNIDAYIPQNYFGNDFEKIELYKRIDKVKTIDELLSLKEEMIDKTGKLPKEIQMLFEKKEIDLFEEQGLIDSYQEYEHYVLFCLSQEINKKKGIGIQLFDLANRVSNQIILMFRHNRIEVKINKIEDWIFLARDFISRLNYLVCHFVEEK